MDDFADYAAARWSRLVRTAVLLGCQLPEAEDVVQETLIRCYRHWRKVSHADDRDAYVNRILVNTLRRELGRSSRRSTPVAEVPEEASPDFSASVDRTAVVHQALGQLKPDAREVVVLRFYAELTIDQIAAALKIPSGTVKSRLSRGLAVLETSEEFAAAREGRGSND